MINRETITRLLSSIGPPPKKLTASEHSEIRSEVDESLKPSESARIEISLNSSTGPTITLRNGESKNSAGVMVIKVNNAGDPDIFLRSSRGKKSISLQNGDDL